MTNLVSGSLLCLLRFVKSRNNDKRKRKQGDSQFCAFFLVLEKSKFESKKINQVERFRPFIAS